MNYSDDYFNEEIRDGYRINAMMKRYWAANMEVLAEIDRICRELNIVYLAEFGTLLGAVRHRGYIPWDDDIDISMTRDAFEVFRREAPELLTGGMTIYNNLHTAFGPMRVVNTIAPQIAPDFLAKYHGCPYSAGVDIYILDKVPADEKESNAFKMLQNSIRYLAQRFETKKTSISDYQKYYGNDGHSERDVAEMLNRVEKETGVHINREADVAIQLTELLNTVQGKYWDSDCDKVVHMHNWCRERSKPTDIAYYTEIVRLKFENMEISCPIEYDKVLMERFGSDYMTPKQIGACHEKAYAKSQKILLDTFAACGIQPPAEYLE
ncbi:MAG: LicD family protein [Lachnospiraceae bacterium]|nr:LicD family protein [Candidatus Colinaster scatohippi]